MRTAAALLLVAAAAAPAPPDAGSPTDPASLPAASASAAPDLAALLARAYALQDAVDRARDGGSEVVTTRQETLAGDGRVKEWEERAVRYTKTRPEKAELLRWRKDGRDMSAEERAEAQRSFDNEDRFDLDSPFRAACRAKYRFRLLPGGGPRVRVAFEPAGRTESRLNTGEIELEPDGRPVVARMHPSDLPFYIKRLECQLEFGPGPAGPEPARMVIDAVGGVLFYSRHVRATTTWSDRVRRADPGATASAGLPASP